MKRNVRKIVSAFLAVLILSAVAVPAYALPVHGTLYETADFYASVYSIYQKWKETHPDSDDSDYSGYGGGRGGGFIDKGGGSFSKSAYDSYVETLPASGYNSSGKLLWQPKVSDISNPEDAIFDGHYISSIPWKGSNSVCSILSSGNGFSVDILVSKTNWNFYFQGVKFTAPFSGIYQRVECVHVSSKLKGDFPYKGVSLSNRFYVSAGGLIAFGDSSLYKHDCDSDLVYVYLPVYEVALDAESADT